MADLYIVHIMQDEGKESLYITEDGVLAQEVKDTASDYVIAANGPVSSVTIIELDGDIPGAFPLEYVFTRAF